MSTREANGSRDDHTPRDLHNYQYVGPYRLEKTLGKGQTGNNLNMYIIELFKLMILV